MTAQTVSELVLLCVLLVFSIFTSLAETSLIAASRVKLKQRMSEGSRTARQVMKILESPERLFGTVLVVNNIANLLSASLATAIAFDLFGSEEEAIAAATAAITFLVIVGEVTSKTIAVKKPEKFSGIVVYPVHFLILVFSPVVAVFTRISRMFMKLFGISGESKSLVTEEEIRAMIHIGEQEGSIAREEGQMLQKVFRFGDMTVREAMTPVSDMVALNIRSGYEEIMQTVLESGYSRLPVYENAPGNIVGIVQVKDLLSFWDHRALIILQDVMESPMLIPSTKKISEQLKEFQRGKSHMAIVTDGAGKTVGIMTLEDIIEEIVGEIEDEFDARFTEIEQVSPGMYTTSGYCRIQKIKEVLGIQLLMEEFVTLNGYMIHTLGHVPKPGESLEVGGVELIARKVEGHRIIRVEIRKKV